MRSFLILMVLLLLCSAVSQAQNGNGIEPESLIERILAVDAEQHAQLRDVVFDADLIEYDENGKGGRGEKHRFTKKVYVKFLPDTAWLHEEYLEYYKEKELQSEKDFRKEAKDRIEKKKKRKQRDISFPIIRPFHPEYRALYNISYEGVAQERIEDYTCLHFKVEALEEIDSLIIGDFYFEAETFHLVRADFRPAALTSKAMFKMKKLNLSLTFGPTADGVWLPTQFDAEGKGKAALFFGVTINVSEYFRNPVINQGIDDSVFEVADEQ